MECGSITLMILWVTRALAVWGIWQLQMKRSGSERTDHSFGVKVAELCTSFIV